MIGRSIEMRRLITCSALFVLAGLAAPRLILAAKVGQPALDFTGNRSTTRVSLSDYHGKFVAWNGTTMGCPYPQKTLYERNMQKLQKQWTAQGVVWFTNYLFGAGKTRIHRCVTTVKRWELRPNCRTCSTNGARLAIYMTPRQLRKMIIINPQGVIIYDGRDR